MAKTRQRDDDIPEWATREAQDLSTEDPAAQQVAKMEDTEQRYSGEVVTAGPAMTSLMEWLMAREIGDDMITARAMEDAVSRILAKEGDAATILESDIPLSGKTFTDRPFALTGFEIIASDLEGGSHYAQLSIMHGQPPRPRLLRVGGVKVLAKLMMLERAGEWPVVCMLHGDKTKRGFEVLDLVPPM